MSIKRSDYHAAAAACIARINLELERNGLTPSDIQRITTQWALEGKEKHTVTMADLYQYRKGKSLPKTGKLEVLAKVLKCDPSELVPPHMQKARLTVRSRINAQPDELNERLLKVELVPGDPAYATLEARVILAAADAYKLLGVLNKLHYVTDARRRGMSEEWIKETFNPTPLPQPPAPVYDDNE